MKMSYRFIYVLLISHCCSSVCGLLLATDASDSEADAYSTDDLGDAQKSSLLETQTADSLAQRRALLSKLQKEEMIEHAERAALLAEQKAMEMMQRQQQALQARAAVLERNEANTAKSESQAQVKEEGTLGDEVTESELVMPHLFNGQPAKTEAAQATTPIPQYKESEEQFWDRQNQQFISHMTAIGFYMLTTIIAGAFYMQCMSKSAVEKVPETAVHTDGFQFGAFDCRNIDRDFQICLCSLCCEWVRWADTASHPKIDFLPYWPALFITALLASCSSITFGATIPILLLLVIAACGCYVLAVHLFRKLARSSTSSQS